MTQKIRASAILIKNNKILVIKSKYSSEKIIYLLPGGRVEAYESIENAAIREVKEETDLDIKIIQFVAHSQYIDKERGKDVLEIIFLGRIVSGEEIYINDPSDGNHILELEWTNYEDLCKKEFYPKKLLQDIKILLTENLSR